jgi:hypothetical protein
MNSSWAASLEQLWRSPTFPMWLTLAAAGFFAIILLLTLLRAEKSVANGALTVITLLAIGIAVAATIRSFGPGGLAASREAGIASPVNVALPALSCIDDLAGESVETACEKVLFGSADAAAAAVSYAAGRVSRLLAFGDVAIANRSMTPELDALRRSIERDRYGLMAYVLVARDHCNALECAAFRSLTDHNQIASNMDERVYDGMISHYSPSWNAPPAAAVAALPPPAGPTGKPTTADFPSAASIPPVNIMTPEPLAAPPAGAARPAPPAAANAQAATPRPAAAAAAKKPPAAKGRAAPVQLAPAAPSADNAN